MFIKSELSVYVVAKDFVLLLLPYCAYYKTVLLYKCFWLLLMS